MAGQDQSLHRQEHGLDPQDHRMHEADRIDHVQEQPATRAHVALLKFIMVVGVGVGDAAPPGRDALEVPPDRAARALR